MPNLYTQGQACQLVKDCSYLIRKLILDGYPVTHILIFPNGMGKKPLYKSYALNETTAEEVAELYGSMQNLEVIAVNLSAEEPYVIACKFIEDIISYDELEKSFNNYKQSVLFS